MGKCIRAEFMSNQYRIKIEGSLSKKVDNIEEKTGDFLEEYLCDMDDAQDVDVDYVGGDYIINIDFNVDFRYDDVMDKVTKSVNSFINDNK